MSPESAVHLEPAGANADGFRARQLTRAALDDYDIADPYGRDEAAYAHAAELMAAAVDKIAKGLSS